MNRRREQRQGRIPVSAYFLAAALLFGGASASWAGQCGPNFVNPLTDVSWPCVFPIRIGGMIQSSAGGDGVVEDPDTISNPICTCGGNIGVSMSFWEPSRMIDTVSDPYCFMALGKKLANPTPGRLSGSLNRGGGSNRAFQQLHYYIFPAWAVLDMFTDLPCADKKSLTITASSLRPCHPISLNRRRQSRARSEFRD